MYIHNKIIRFLLFLCFFDQMGVIFWLGLGVAVDVDVNVVCAFHLWNFSSFLYNLVIVIEST